MASDIGKCPTCGRVNADDIRTAVEGMAMMIERTADRDAWQARAERLAAFVRAWHGQHQLILDFSDDPAAYDRATVAMRDALAAVTDADWAGPPEDAS